MKELMYFILAIDRYHVHTHAYTKMPPTEKMENNLQPKIPMLCLNISQERL
jgi:hypothetical protein